MARKLRTGVQTEVIVIEKPAEEHPQYEAALARRRPLDGASVLRDISTAEPRIVRFIGVVTRQIVRRQQKAEMLKTMRRLLNAPRGK